MNLDIKNIDPFEEEDWNEKEPEFVEYRIFYHYNNKYILFGKYYDNDEICIMSDDFEFYSNLIFYFENIISKKNSTIPLKEKILNDDVLIILAGSLMPVKFSKIKKHLNDKLKISLL